MIRGSLLLTTMLVCLPQMARAGDPVQQLFVELVVNGRATGDLVPLRIVAHACSCRPRRSAEMA
ncbi:hypothetical protein [Sphingomonas sp. Ant20]|uniref:hypothetical protein n=1 Tax=Sphingomonas sp. Ant20 TaxID=104605 RepID=UPI00068C1CB8|nr:hypothetical protein [Sphingomonas sp. Ant20]